MNEQLIAAVSEQLDPDYPEIWSDIANHGGDSGWCGFTHHSDTVPFAEKHKDIILQSLRDQAEELGYDGAYSTIASFNCLNGGWTTDDIADVINGHGDSDDYDLIMNALAWYALEEVARHMDNN